MTFFPGTTLINVSFGRLQERNPNYGVKVNCYICGAEHKGYGVARIDDLHVPLCKPCLVKGDDEALLRKYYDTHDLKIKDSGERESFH
jgi:hypothetical protein